jgi:hypothetical protein
MDLVADEARVFDTCKAPVEYLEYKCTLPPDLAHKANEDFREDDLIKKQHIEKFREWIVKNPRIKRCRTDGVFLLRFLRCTHFNFPAACERLEKYLASRELYPQYLKYFGDSFDDPDFLYFIRRKYVVFIRNEATGEVTLLQRDAQYYRHKKITEMLVKFYLLACEIIMEDERVQVRGMNIVGDVSGASLEATTAIPLPEFVKILKAITKPLIRNNALVAACLPPLLKAFADQFIPLLSKKIQGRCVVSIAFLRPFYIYSSSWYARNLKILYMSRQILE